MRRFILKEYDDIFSCFPISEEVGCTNLYAVKFVKYLCERDDVYQPYPDVDNSEIYMKIPNDGTIFMDISIEHGTAKLQFNDTRIYYTVEYDSDCEDDKCGTVEWNGGSLPTELYHILYKNPIKDLVDDSYSCLSKILSDFKEIKEKYAADNELVPQSVIDKIDSKTDIVEGLKSELVEILKSRYDNGWKDLTKCNDYRLWNSN